MSDFGDLKKILLDSNLSDEDLEKFCRNAIQGSLLNQILHESNNQLTGILGYISLLQKNIDLSDKAKTFLEKSIRCCKTNQWVNDSFLKLFYPPDNVLFHTPQTFPDLIAFCNKVFGSSCSLLLRTSSSLSNLPPLDNPFKTILFYLFMVVKCDIKDQGKIVVDVEINPHPKDHSCDLMVHISGQSSLYSPLGGMDKNKLASAHQCLRQLSLYFAETLAQENNCELSWVGTMTAPVVYKMKIPKLAVPEPLKEPTGIDQSKPERSRKNARIVLLEDRSLVADFMEDALKEHGYRVLLYKNGIELADALPSIKQSDVDIFLLDICVPGINGIEIASRIRKKEPDSRILFCSVLQDEKNILDHFTLDNKTKFLPKPFEKHELIDLVQLLAYAKE